MLRPYNAHLFASEDDSHDPVSSDPHMCVSRHLLIGYLVLVVLLSTKLYELKHSCWNPALKHQH